MKLLAAILAAILNFSGILDLDLKFDHLNEISDPQNILFDTKITFLCAIIKEIWLFEIDGGHLGGHLGFLKTLHSDRMSL